MPLWVPQVLLALIVAVTAVTAIWLLLNLHAVAWLFRRSGVVEPGPGPRRASRRLTVIMLILFNIGWISSIAVWSWVITGEANEMVDADM